MKHLILMVIFLSSAGCASEAEQRAQAQAEAHAQAASDNAVCRGYGALPGTPVYIQCRMNLDNQRAASAETSRVLATQVLLNRPLF